MQAGMILANAFPLIKRSSNLLINELGKQAKLGAISFHKANQDDS
jgi:hypothetical protein